ncbi:malonyl CoA-ACP transacylase [Mixta theicola]|uniref:[acyl-carrier-protein] S-malonyltransferase n=1 Tax=Mixta theicola TaxID=1458355 RepID=A0A2K1QEH5_9GAMM|nr:ACP S-malonyltransferase [Mixta theicola]PNS13428.1 malonyl CoA-ACP transacylase [Mixta theicola]GLR09740.1 malonyl CoA-ACP transacylase [Mixta theicola]
MDINHQKRPAALIFAGQGSPVTGMGADLWDINQHTRRIWDCASDVSGIDIRRVCLKGPVNKLVQTPVQQLAVTAINITFYTLLREKGIKITASCGHSVGEYSALYAAGAITLEALFSLIHFRAATMHELSKRNKGSMLAVKGVDYLTTRKLIADHSPELDISCDNSCRQQVVGGTTSALSEFSRRARCETIRLGVSGAWHTRLMQEGVQPMRDYLAAVTIGQPRHKVLMNVSGQPEYHPQAIRENLSLHLTHTVKWTGIVEHLLAEENPPLLIDISHKAWLASLLSDFPAFSPQRLLHCRKILLCH